MCVWQVNKRYTVRVGTSLRRSNAAAYGANEGRGLVCAPAARVVTHQVKNSGAPITNLLTTQGYTMNDRFEGNWLQFKGKVKEQWGKLTDDDLDIIAGRRDQLLGKIQERHAIHKDEAEKQFTDWHAKNPTNFFERY